MAHNVFISFHHANDESRKKIFELRFGNRYGAIVGKAVQDGSINPNLPTDTIREKIRDEFIRDATVTVVLIGIETWQRKHVDWEIASSLRDTRRNHRCGLLGILLPTHPSYNKRTYNPCIIPPRLYDNLQCGYAAIHNWSESPDDIGHWVNQAFLRRGTKTPDQSRDLFKYNKSGSSWC